MLQTIIKKNSYQDSVVLMMLTSKLNQLSSVVRVSIMMGTPANKDILIAGGFDTVELADASANDMVVMLEVNDNAEVDKILAVIEEELTSQSDSQGEMQIVINSWEKAISALPDANIALISIPGTYAALEIEKALDYGLHAFVFSDNVTLEDEHRLKAKAHEKGLLVMGPDCGTGIIKGVPLAFTNIVRKGKISVIGASGTGIQEVTTLIHRFGGGVTNAIGTGGRDLTTDIGAISMLDSIVALDADEETDVVVIISKPPAPEIAEKVSNLLRTLTKPVVTLFLGSKPTEHEKGFYHAYTLEETAQLATQLLFKQEVSYEPKNPQDIELSLKEQQTGIKGFYSGGTLAYEAGFLLQDALGITNKDKTTGYIFKHGAHEIIDLGDDMYTNGKPHPMIDSEIRVEKFLNLVSDEETAAVIFDVVLGYGAHDNMAGELAGAINRVRAQLAEKNIEMAFIATVVGSDADHQGYDAQVDILTKAGVIVCENNVQAVRTALKLINRDVSFIKKPIVPKLPITMEETSKVSPAIQEMLTHAPRVINVGLKSFTESISEQGGEVVHFDWRPSAGGDVMLQKALYYLTNYQFNQSEEEL